MEAELGWIGQVGGWAGMVSLTALLWWMLATGRLYTKSQHESIVELHKDGAAKDAKIIQEQSDQIQALLEGTATAKDFFEKVPVHGPDGDTLPKRKATKARESPR